MKKLLTTAAALASCGVFILAGQQETPVAVYTTAQADAGRAAFHSKDCVSCHTEALTGRRGEPGERPPIDSLPAGFQQTIRGKGGKVPPLAGPDFMAKWGVRTTKDLATRITLVDKEDYLNLTAYVLQVNGAQPGTQALTADTAVEIRAVAAGAASQR